MGLQIGGAFNNGFAVVRNPGATSGRGASAQSPPPEIGFVPPDEDQQSANPFTRREAAPPPRIGFGEGSVSVPAAAVRTLDRNLEEASKLIPTLEETRERLRERLTEVQEQLQSEAEPRETRGFDVTVGVANAVSNVRTLIAGLNQAAAAAQAKVQGTETAEAPGRRIDIRVGDQSVAFYRRDAAPTVEFFA
ncbi:MAG: hypothetical protein IT364_02885 [Candidatus Hydrogenedentes bacterium]|nr:hypothetical protein [Candidatus Hydrogenedentota bacterium]